MADITPQLAAAHAAFAASAIARLAHALRQAGVIDEVVIGELAGVAIESGSGKGSDVVKAMEILCIQLGAKGKP